MRAAAGLAGLLAATCAASDAARAPLSGPPTYAFDCAGETLEVVLFERYATTLWSTRGATLPREPSRAHASEASVRRYAAAPLALELGRDGFAIWQQLDRPALRCSPQPVRALEARARLRGSWLVALGSGSSWSLEILPDFTGRAIARLEVPRGARPTLWSRGLQHSAGRWAAGRSRYIASLADTGAGPLRIELDASRRCEDARLGAPLLSIHVQAAQANLVGCARIFE